jgi:glycosyltransferase involved in cell wall biosynthesis
VFLDFVPPWQIPSIVKACTCIISLEKENSPVYDYHTSALPYEALASGKCVLMSHSVHKKDPYRNLENGKDVLIVNPDNTVEIKKILKNLIENPKITADIGNRGYDSIKKNDFFNVYIDQTTAIYKSILSK